MARGGGWSFRSNYDDFMACLNDDQLETAVEIFARHFERCGLDEMNLPNRNEHARRVLDALRTGGGAIAGVGDLQWPSDTPQWGTYADHWGLDIQAGMGTPVFASADGIVVNAKFVGTWGNYVRINTAPSACRPDTPTSHASPCPRGTMCARGRSSAMWLHRQLDRPAPALRDLRAQFGPPRGHGRHAHLR